MPRAAPPPRLQPLSSPSPAPLQRSQKDAASCQAHRPAPPRAALYFQGGALATQDATAGAATTSGVRLAWGSSELFVPGARYAPGLNPRKCQAIQLRHLRGPERRLRRV